MAFTDDDLKRSKADGALWPSYELFKIPALLARLEAAEIALEHFIDCTPVNDTPTLLDEEVLAWRKSAGK